MRTRDYIEAGVDLLQEGKRTEEVFSGLLRMLNDRKQSALYGKILKGIHARISRKVHLESPRLILAKKSDGETHQKEINDAVSELNLEHAPSPEIDENLIGGFILLGNGSRIDRSYKTHLLNLYQSLTR